MSRLLPESLMEGKCLNKSWYSVIKCLEFVTKHLHHSKASPATLLVYHGLWLGNPTEGRLASIDHLSSELMTRLLTTTPSRDNTGEKDGVNWAAEDLDLPHYLFGHGHVSVHHCNGIICLIKDSKTVTLCNPALHKFSTFHPETDLVIKHYRILGTGFGSDSRDGDYNIVRLLKAMKAEVFTPGTTTNSWREITISIEDEQYGNLDSHVYFDGNCFWLMFGAQLTVLCFNLRSEVFTPYLCQMNSTRSMNHVPVLLSVMIPFDCLESGNSILMWEMNVRKDETGIAGYSYSCRKSLDIKPFNRFYFPLAFWKNDELLMKDTHNGMLSYNVRS